MQMAINTAEALKYVMMVESILATGRMIMILPLATSSKYTVRMSSGWERNIWKMKSNGTVAHTINQMAKRRSMNIE